MPKTYVCDNPKCGSTFHIDDQVDVYCESCTPLSNQWAAMEKQLMAEHADKLARDLIKEREKFFAQKTPNTRASKPEAKPKRGKSGSTNR